MRKIILGGTLITPLETLHAHALVIQDGRITALLPQSEQHPLGQALRQQAAR